MNIAAILALLLSSGVCAKTDFNGPDGTILRVVVCPVLSNPDAVPQGEPRAPAKPKKEERQA